jgi:hypothetical protein
MTFSRPLVFIAALASSVTIATPALAATSTSSGAVRHSVAAAQAGYDVSYPQCGSSLPTGQSFGVVGVNGGKATTANGCLSTQLAWAWRSTGAVPTQQKAQLYVNTADPGQVISQVSTWPTSGGNATYGTCNGTNTPACSWQYGWERAKNDVTAIFGPAVRSARVDATAGHYTWWLDVETSNTWETGSAAALADNRAALEGMTAYLQGLGARVGVYSTNQQWSQIVGTVPASSSLYKLNSWMAGASNAQGATSNGGNRPLGPAGRVTLSQYVSGGLDHDVSCG